MTDMKEKLPMLFLGTICPNCRAIERQLGLPSLDSGVHEDERGFWIAVIPTGGETEVVGPDIVPAAESLAYADDYNVTRVPFLLTEGGGRRVIDPFEIVAELNLQEEDDE